MGTKMRIAQIAPLTEAVPPKLYGGTERVVSWLTEALVEQGHDVTLFASGDSVTAAKLEPMWPRALRLDGAIPRSECPAGADARTCGALRTEIRPLLACGGVEFIGEIGDGEKAQFLSGALALLVPIDWPEPFGLVMIEAMACGTPVLAFKGGSVPEIVEHGLTGAIVENVEEAITAMPLVIALDRKKVRQRFVQRFSATRMANDYFDLYRSLLNSARSLAGEDRNTRHRSPESKHANYPKLHAV